MDYLHSVCPKCGQKFNENDDIVVCPECGTPEHRSCYLEEGNCVNLSLHGTDFSWQPQIDNSEIISDIPNDSAKDSSATAPVCPVCGFTLDPMLPLCPQCGHRLTEGSEKEALRRAQEKFFEADFDGIKVKEAVAYIGSMAPIYLRRFANMQQSNKRVSWNWGAAIFGPFWCFYRGLHKIGLLLLALTFCMSIATTSPEEIAAMRTALDGIKAVQNYEASPQEVLEQTQAMLLEADSSQSELSLFLSYGFSLAKSICLALFADSLYRKKLVSDVKKIKSNNLQVSETGLMAQIVKKGKPKYTPVILGLALYYILQFAAIFILTAI